MIKPAALEQFWACWEMIRQSWKSQIQSKPTSLEISQKSFCWQFPPLLTDIDKEAVPDTAGIQLNLHLIGL